MYCTTAAGRNLSGEDRLGAAGARLLRTLIQHVGQMPRLLSRYDRYLVHASRTYAPDSISACRLRTAEDEFGTAVI